MVGGVALKLIMGQLWHKKIAQQFFRSEVREIFWPRKNTNLN